MSPKSKEQFEEIRTQTVLVIKETALELFAENGFHNTSISQIAKAAKISKGLMYNYFESKDELLKAIITDAMEMGNGFMRRYLDEAASPEEQMRGLIDGVFEWIVDNLKYWKLLAALAFQPAVTKSMEGEVIEKAKEHTGMVTDLFRKMGKKEPEKEALLYGALMDGIGMQYMVMPEVYPLEEMKQLVIQKIFEK
jgi:AcrR family transcriptional regulator